MIVHCSQCGYWTVVSLSPRSPIFPHFHAVFLVRKFGQNIRLAHPALGLAFSPSGKSWIRHWQWPINKIVPLFFSVLHLCWMCRSAQWMMMVPCPVVDPWGRQGQVPPSPKLFIFIQFTGKLTKIIGCHPTFGISAPPLGNPGSATFVQPSVL